jgi:CheY-like chemotaxis protein
MGDTKSVYVVDDDEIFHFIIKKLLGQYGNLLQHLAITSFFSAEDALEQLRTNSGPFPSLIILDMNMQHMNGWEFIEAYRSIKHTLLQSIPIIMCSSSMDVRDIQKVQGTPELSAYITKPLDKHKLKVIEQYL